MRAAQADRGSVFDNSVERASRERTDSGISSRRSHKIDHRNLLGFSQEKSGNLNGGAIPRRCPAQLARAALGSRRWQSANYPSADIRFQTRV